MTTLLTSKRVLQLLVAMCIFGINSNVFASDYSIYQINPFTNSTTIDEENSVSELSITVSRNEVEPVRFALKSRVDRLITGINASEPRKVNSRLNFVLKKPEVYVLHEWEQMKNYASLRGESILMHSPTELLLKNDLNIPHGVWKNNKYIPPDYYENFQTKLYPYESKQFWVSFDIPKNQPAGIYRGELILKSSVGDVTVPYSVTVLDITLENPDKAIGIFFRGSIENNKRNISNEMLRAQLQNIKDHSVDALVIYEREEPTLDVFMSAVKKAVIGGPIVLESGNDLFDNHDLLLKKIDLIKSYGYTVYLAGVDEPNTKERLNNQLKVARNATQSGLNVFTSLTTDTYKKLQKRDMRPAWSNINIKHLDVEYFSTHEKLSTERITYYWQLYLENMPRNRLYAGLQLFQSDLDGVMPYTYQAFHSVDPYTTDVRVLRGNERRLKRVYKNFMTTYPTTSEPINTVQWESFREGVDDYRYIALLEELTDLAKKTLPDNSAEVLNSIRYLQKIENMTLDVESSDLAIRLHEIRSNVIDNILEVQSVL